LYKNLFDPSNEKLEHLHGENKKLLLNDLIETIEREGDKYKEAIKDLKGKKKSFTDDDYEAFVMGLLNKIKANQPQPPTKKSPIKTPTNYKNRTVTAEPQPKRISDIFNQSIEAYNVAVFVDNDPTSLIPSQFMDAKQFVGRIIHGFDVSGFLDEKQVLLNSYSFENIKRLTEPIKYNLKSGNNPNKDGEPYREIIEFTDTLVDYIDYLEQHMKSELTEVKENRSYLHERYELPSTYTERYEMPTDGNEEFVHKTHEYRKQLNLLLVKIKALIKADNKSA
jgi:hypothetical protein